MSGLSATQGSAPASSAPKPPGGDLKPPAISMPKGGGAMRGIGEKFSVQPATGTASFSIPVYTSPGRAGFEPDLKLSYSSGSGNGIFGLGWQLNLPSITRKTDKGLPQYNDAEDSDVFLLSGAEDLVPLKEPPEGAAATDGDYRIRYYRPRTEGLFSRIERWTRLSNGQVHWRTISRENITAIYGQTPTSRITEPGTEDRIYSWLICESYDSKGNAMVYEYAEEDSRNVDLTLVSERNRERGTARYLKRVKYGNRTSRLIEPDLSKTDWLFEVVFDYDEGHVEEIGPASPGLGEERMVVASVTPERAWSVRPDVTSSYRAGFEIRTYRRCRRILIFHRFEELGPEPSLVRSTTFEYNDLSASATGSPLSPEEELSHPGSTRFGSILCTVTQSGYIREEGVGERETIFGRYTYLCKSLPPIELEYSRAVIQDELRELPESSLENLPAGLSGAYQWVDLEGEGVSGILTEQAGGWFYKPNEGEGQFGSLMKVASKPAFGELAGGRLQLLDLDGNGRLEAVAFSGPTPGYHERAESGEWSRFQPFLQLPNIRWDDPNLHFVDLDGDGHADLLVMGEDVFTWSPSLAKKGFGAAKQVYPDSVQDSDPRLVTADGAKSVFLADMSGDGLADLVRIRNGEICYWPNLGYGRFGAKITMADCPWFDHPDAFRPDRLRLADIDGSGLTDILYLGQNDIHVYYNQSGNRWSGPRAITGLPSVHSHASVSVIDLLGNGTSCLVWSSSLENSMGRPICYIDLTGGQKPQLLVRTANNLGAETRIHYASSTKFYLAAQQEGNPWVTKLPFPVHVVEKVETFDRISGNRFATRYAYRHGYFDGYEREFRGFGMVEQWDSEAYGSSGGNADFFPEGTNESYDSHVPPVLTRSWYHTGAYLDRYRLSAYFAEHEYYREPEMTEAGARQLLLEEFVLPEGLSPEEEREACRALKGMLLRQEVYALDGTDKESHPYTVTEHNYTVKLLQARQGEQSAIFVTHSREQISFNYERNPQDPRTLHSIVMETDDYGNETKLAVVSYGRRQPDLELAPRDQIEQSKITVVLTDNLYTIPVARANDYRAPLPSEIRSYELTGLQLRSGQLRFQLADLELAWAGAVPIDYEVGSGSSPDTLTLRMIEHVKTLYRRDDLTGPLPAGQLEALALPYGSYRLAFTPGLLEAVYGGRAEEAVLLDEGRYVRLEEESGFWIPSEQVYYSPSSSDAPEEELAYASAHFFLPERFRDPLHREGRSAETIISYDRYDLLVTETCDPLGSRMTVGLRPTDPAMEPVPSGHDYRVLKPALVMDPNRNCSAVVYDALGMVTGSAVMGKPEDLPSQGDTLEGFAAELTQAEALRQLKSPLAAPHAVLQRATSRIIYDWFAYMRTMDQSVPEPPVVYTLSRVTHDSDLAAGEQTALHYSFLYSDGFGREIQKKIQAEPGQVPLRDPASGHILTAGGQPVLSAEEVFPRWVGSGWTVYNNKGKPVRQFEPFFTDTPSFDRDVRIGVSPVNFYDPAGRVAAVLYPDRTWKKEVYSPWKQTSWDGSDTLLLDPANDSDAGDYFRRLPETEYLPTWYGQRAEGLLGPDEQEAAVKASVHANTPGARYFDSLGRTFLTVEHNRCKRSDSPPDAPSDEEFFESRTVYDIEGNIREVIDAAGRTVMHSAYDMLGTTISESSMEAGERWTLYDVGKRPVRTWSSGSVQSRTVYDVLGRAIETYHSVGDSPTVMTGRIVYGESMPEPERFNQRGKKILSYDQAGLLRNDEYDFKGNLLRSRRELAAEYKTTLNWALDVLLEAESYETRTRYDALNRAIQITAPDSSIIRPSYNEANLLNAVEANLRGEEQDGESTWTPFVANIDYNAKGQRTHISYGNGVQSLLEYDPFTFRLIGMRTIRDKLIFPGDCPQPPRPDWPGCELQHLHYTYDPAGNIMSIRDDAQQAVFFLNRRVEPSSRYTYDALNRLVEAAGREHLGQIGGSSAGPTAPDALSEFHSRLAHPSDGNAMGTFIERYVYDAVGNLLSMQHRGSDPVHPGWTRSFGYQEQSLLQEDKVSNRLSSTATSASAELYKYEGSAGMRGNMTSMPHLPFMQWNELDQLRATSRQAVSADSGATPEITWYTYDAGGQRVRKVTERYAAPGVQPTRWKERIYLGPFEIYREFAGDGDTIEFERESLHIMDGKQRMALVETRTEGAEDLPARLIRYQIGNHLGSAHLELDHTGQIITYEEFTPYGSTSFQSVRNQNEAPKRYRYTGKERDEESGLQYHGSRYYAAWLARWISCDPKLLIDGSNLYRYVSSNPVKLIDPNGTNELKPPNVNIGFLGDPINQKMGDLWSKAVNEVLGKEFQGKAPNELMKLFRDKVEHLKNTKGMGSNRQQGTAINYARETYSKVRTVFGKLAKEAGIAMDGVQVHHFGGGLAEMPHDALDASGLIMTTGQAGVKGTGHFRLHELEAKFADMYKKLMQNKGLASKLGSAVEKGADALKPVAGLAAKTGSVLKKGAEALEPLAKVASKAGKVMPVVAAAFVAGDAYAATTAQTGSERFHKSADTVAGLAGFAGPVGMAFSAGYGAGGLINDGLQAVGADLSKGLSAIDETASKLWTDPSKPAHTQTIGWKMAELFE
ncbi:SpvB/TcaC N-terminal domain-containing protein [Paenibacillus apii]|uniref:SpvB/TcaC N-terminal domain-containing protein n=1 Tax=Paenibacillus apii TaxID=1850370 RepID=UPI00143B433D|nr:SpvB/TcaC N-terminal domain-containing protein [Paenibacillus apii]NJJ40875.1 toxin [Paenibacillus apii]